MIFIDSTVIEQTQGHLPTIVASRQTFFILVDERDP